MPNAILTLLSSFSTLQSTLHALHWTIPKAKPPNQAHTVAATLSHSMLHTSNATWHALHSRIRTLNLTFRSPHYTLLTLTRSSQYHFVLPKHLPAPLCLEKLGSMSSVLRIFGMGATAADATAMDVAAMDVALGCHSNGCRSSGCQSHGCHSMSLRNNIFSSGKKVDISSSSSGSRSGGLATGLGGGQFELEFSLKPLYIVHVLILTLHSTLHTLHFQLHSTLNTPHFKFPTTHFPFYALISHSTLYSLHFALCTPHCTLYTWHFARHTRQISTGHTVHSPPLVLHTLHSTLDTPHLHSPRFTLHTPPSTHHTLYTYSTSTLHLRHYTLHSALHISHLRFTHSTLQAPRFTLYALRATFPNARKFRTRTSFSHVQLSIYEKSLARKLRFHSSTS